VAKTRVPGSRLPTPSVDELRELGEAGLDYPLKTHQILVVVQNLHDLHYAHQRNLKLLETERDLMQKLRLHVEEQGREFEALRHDFETLCREFETLRRQFEAKPRKVEPS